MTPSVSIEQAFRHCEKIARDHYENFPVASLFIPKALRPSVAAIYAFARTADDFADEGTFEPSERLQKLNDWRRQLDECYAGKAVHPIFIALAEVSRRRNIPKQLLADLLTAFTMDVTITRYRTFDDLLHYCRHSANPVGRLVLHLFDDASERNCMYSDNICTALQLANFWQDVRLDAQKGRIYIPLEDMHRIGYTEGDLVERRYDERFVNLLQVQVARTRKMFDAGKPLLSGAVPGLRFELRLTWRGGTKILDKIERRQFNVFAARPALGIIDKIGILTAAFIKRSV